jgi:hypothetical protein
MSLAVLDVAGLDALIGRFGDAELVGKGGLLVLGFEAIRDRSGGRWAIRQESVREFIERQFQKYFLPSDQLVRLDDVNFLVIQPSESGFGAQARALKLFSEVLRFFLGASARSDVKLSRVTRMGPDGLEITPVEVSDADLTRLATMDWDAGPPTVVDDPGAEQGAAITTPSPAMSIVDSGKRSSGAALRGDRTYEAMFLTEPIWSIRQRAVVSYRLRPLIFELQADRLVDANLAKASPGDLTRLNLLVLAEAERLFRDKGADRRFALHIPIHQASLGASAGRQTLLATLERLQPLASSSVVVVLIGLESGAPHSRIVTLTSALAGRCRAVIALAPDLDCKIDRWRDAHLSGVAVDLNVLASSNEQLSVKRMSEFAARSQGVAPALISYSTPNTAVLLAAWSAGFTHIGGELINRYSDGLLQPLRLNPIDLYRGKA